MPTTLLPSPAASVENGEVTVSIIIPTKNRPRDLVDAVVSLLAQGRLPDEIIIVDQSATSESDDRVQRLFDPYSRNGTTRLIYIRDERIAGASAARNLGVDLSCGDLIVFLDDDVVLETDFVRELLAAYECGSDVIGVSGTVTNYRKPAPLRRLLRATFWRGPFHDERQPIYWNAERLRGANPIPVRKFGSGGMSLRRTALGKIRFDEKLKGVPPGEDVDLCCHLPASSQLVIAPRARYEHRATNVNRRREHWLKKDAEAMYYLFLRNWDHGFTNRLCFLWLNFGYVCLAAAGCVKRRSLEPWRAWREGVQAALEHVL
jgi:GT2 family glycosyltransferase